MSNLNIIIVVFVWIIILLIYISFFNKIRNLYLKLKNPNYVKKSLSKEKWMGKQITPQLIKKMSLITSILATLFLIISIYILVKMGANKVWAVLTTFGLLLIYVAILWINYNNRHSKIKINKSNVKFESIYSKISLIFFIGAIILVSTFKEIAMSTPYFQIWIIGLALFLIITSEIHYQKLIS